MREVHFRAMGCQMTALVDSDEPAAAEALARVPGWFETWEQHLSRFRAESELSRLNAQAGRPLHVSPVLWEAVHLALDVARLSEGWVVPTLLPALERAGYDFTFDEVIAHPARPAPGPALLEPSIEAWRDIRCQVEDRTIQLPAGARLDLGGTAKGWATAQAATALSAWGPALVDAGGDVAVSAPRAGGQGWPVGVADPAEPGSLLALLNLQSGGVATSGRDFRRWQRGGSWQHHLIDTQTGRPAETDVLSATVIAPELWLAEMAAKRVLLLGAEPGLAWLEAQPELAGLVIVEGRPNWFATSRRLADYLRS